ncbi:hypothetical protein POTOM_056697 [Populus tomentosa]|uniref:Uncharacterized protein n=1 Tax=Populus tomentosa TaxID=118781 RepID=A0A8X7XV59_POPTO|nr:hypothetical protein POTOM_056697 [Populus tomentosa]
MSGVWFFKNNGVIRLVENPAADSSGGSGGGSRRKVLVHLPSGQVVSSYSSLEQILNELGWERYYGGDPDLFQFHKQSSIDLISLPRDFSKFNSVYMYDIVIKNPNIFHVRDISQQCITNHRVDATCPNHVWGQECGYARGTSLKRADQLHVFFRKENSPPTGS